MGDRIGSRAVTLVACLGMMSAVWAQVEPSLIKKDGKQSTCVVQGVSGGQLNYKLFPEATRVEKVACSDVLVYIDGALNVYDDACTAAARPATTTRRNCASLIGKDRSVTKCDILEHGDQFKVLTALGEKYVAESAVAVHLEADGELGFQRTEDVVFLLSDPVVLRRMNDASQCPALEEKPPTGYSPKKHTEKLKAVYERQKEVNKVKPRPAGRPLTIDTTGRGVMKEPDFDSFDSIAMYKVKRLEGFIGQIVNVEKSMVDRDNAAMEAIKLFNSPTLNKVEVIGMRDGKESRRNHSVGTYFNSVLKSSKAKVDIRWSQMVFASDWEMQEDSSFRATISIQQTYVKELDGRVVYSDVTNKNIDVIAQVYDKFVDGKFEQWWDVYLGDIGVSSLVKR